MHAFIALIIVVAAFSLVWWGISQLALPNPVRVVILVVMGLIALTWIYSTFAGGAGLRF